MNVKNSQNRVEQAQARKKSNSKNWILEYPALREKTADSFRNPTPFPAVFSGFLNNRESDGAARRAHLEVK